MNVLISILAVQQVAGVTFIFRLDQPSLALGDANKAMEINPESARWSSIFRHLTSVFISFIAELWLPRLRPSTTWGSLKKA